MILIIAGAPFSIWVGSFVSPKDEVAVLVCVAIHGYHPLVEYQWSRDERNLSDEIFPVMYVTDPATYSCTVTGQQGSICKKYCFQIESK